jgi:hypothetical protein
MVGCSLVGSNEATGNELAGESGRGVRDRAAVQPAGSVLSASAATGGLLIELPQDFTLTFEPVPGLNADEQAALTDAAVLFASWYQAIGRGDVDDPLYGRYSAPAVQIDLREVIGMFRANGWTVTGSVLVDRRSAHIADDTAHVTWCADAAQRRRHLGGHRHVIEARRRCLSSHQLAAIPRGGRERAAMCAGQCPHNGAFGRVRRKPGPTSPSPIIGFDMRAPP